MPPTSAGNGNIPGCVRAMNTNIPEIEHTNLYQKAKPFCEGTGGKKSERARMSASIPASDIHRRHIAGDGAVALQRKWEKKELKYSKQNHQRYLA